MMTDSIGKPYVGFVTFFVKGSSVVTNDQQQLSVTFRSYLLIDKTDVCLIMVYKLPRKLIPPPLSLFIAFTYTSHIVLA